MTQIHVEKGPLLDPKVCPKCVQKDGPRVGAIVSVDRARLTKSHRSELNRRPLLVQWVAISGIYRRINEIIERLWEFFLRKSHSRPPEGVSEVCPAFPEKPLTLTNLLRRNGIGVNICGGSASVTRQQLIGLPRDPFKYEGRDLTIEQYRSATELAARRDLQAYLYTRPS